MRHISFPTTRHKVPTSFYISCSRPSVNIYNSRIFLVRVKVYRLNHSVVKVCNPIGSLQTTARKLRNIISLPRIFSREISKMFMGLCIYNVDITRNRRLCIIVDEPLSTFRQSQTMLSVFVKCVCMATLSIV